MHYSKGSSDSLIYFQSRLQGPKIKLSINKQSRKEDICNAGAKEAVSFDPENWI